MIMEFVKLSLFSLLLLALVKAEEEEEELKIEILQKPPADCERKAKDGDFMSVHYTGVLAANGKKFSSSHDNNQPYTFTLGRREVIQGYEVGLQGMCVGEKRRLTVPARMGEYRFEINFDLACVRVPRDYFEPRFMKYYTVKTRDSPQGLGGLSAFSGVIHGGEGAGGNTVKDIGSYGNSTTVF